MMPLDLEKNSLLILQKIQSLGGLAAIAKSH